MIMQNYMNPTLQAPDQRSQMLEWLRSVGYDVGPMMGGGPLQLPGMEDGGNPMQSNPGYRDPMGGGNMPGGSGWDGVNAKMAWLGQRAMDKRRARAGGAGGAEPPKMPFGHPGGGSPNDVDNQGGMGGMGRSGSAFGDLGMMLGGALGGMFKKLGRQAAFMASPGGFGLSKLF